MLIKTIKNGVESDWFELTKQYHRALLKDSPDAVVVSIDDLYPESPDRGNLVCMAFSHFTVLTRDFVLEENRQAKQMERNLDKRPLEEINLSDVQCKSNSLEDEYVRREQMLKLRTALQTLTDSQRRRLELYIEDELSIREIAKSEGVDYSSVKESINAAKKKIKKALGYTPSKRGFLSD